MDDIEEDWLRSEVVPTFDRIMRGEEKLIPASEVFADIELRYNARKAQNSV
ncbi:MAG TPA: hypothetical protein VEL04_06595 [Burkholderiales bacterium]|nr:hypothetical protein [Burkholderiales bacterium]